MQDHRIGSGAGSHEPRQTIEQIEARERDLRRDESLALRSLAAFLRELAVHLPVESRLPARFAKAAKNADMFAGADSPVAMWELERVINEWNRDRGEDLLRVLADWLGHDIS